MMRRSTFLTFSGGCRLLGAGGAFFVCLGAGCPGGLGEGGDAVPCEPDATDGTPCDDGDSCTTDDVCQGGVCTATPIPDCDPGCASDCDDGNVCTDDACVAGECEHTPNSRPCDDGLFCTTDSACQDGACLGSGEKCPGQICDEATESCGDTETGDGEVISEVTIRALGGITKSEFCRGEEIEVVVLAEDPDDPAARMDVHINGMLGSRHFLKFFGDPGPRLIHVSATSGAYFDSQTNEIEITDCEIDHLVLTSTPNRFHNRSADLHVSNHQELGLTSPVYEWDFGDGTTATSAVPFVTHDYSALFDGEEPYRWRLVQVTVGGLTARKMVPLFSIYHFNRQRGILTPRATVVEEDHSRERWFIGRFTIENIEDEAVTFQLAEREFIYCDPERDSTYEAITPAGALFNAPDGSEGAVVPSMAGTGTSRQIDLNECQELTFVGDVVPVPVWVPVPDGTPCNDLNACTDNDSCQGGACVGGKLLKCDDGDPETQDRCDPAVGCVYTPVDDGGDGSFRIEPGVRHDSFVGIERSEFPLGTCELGLHFTGQSESGRPAQASVYFQVQRNPVMVRRVTDDGFRAFLNELVERGIAAEGAAVSEEELNRWWREGKVRRSLDGWEVLP